MHVRLNSHLAISYNEYHDSYFKFKIIVISRTENKNSNLQIKSHLACLCVLIYSPTTIHRIPDNWWTVQLSSCTGAVPVRKGITIVFSLFRSHWLAVMYFLVFCIGSCVPVPEDKTKMWITFISLQSNYLWITIFALQSNNLWVTIISSPSNNLWITII